MISAQLSEINRVPHCFSSRYLTETTRQMHEWIQALVLFPTFRDGFELVDVSMSVAHSGASLVQPVWRLVMAAMTHSVECSPSPARAYSSLHCWRRRVHDHFCQCCCLQLRRLDQYRIRHSSCPGELLLILCVCACVREGGWVGVCSECLVLFGTFTGSCITTCPITWPFLR